MDKQYTNTVRLLLKIAPDVFVSDTFAMKGGTAINLFVQNMPRLSVDIDLVYLPWQKPREQALLEINRELAAIANRVQANGVPTRLVHSKGLGVTKLVAENETTEVKVEVNVVFRGTVLPIISRPLSAKASDLFGENFNAPTIDSAELYAGKFVAALDRQHPRDLFDVWQLFENGGITDALVECFVVYLAGHNRPTHEVLFGNDKDIAADFENAFIGMNMVECSLEQLLDARIQLRRELPRRLSAAQRQFLSSLTHAQPQWELLQYPHIEHLPVLRWKKANLETFQKNRPHDFLAQAHALDAALSSLD